MTKTKQRLTIARSPLSQEQLLHILQKTPESHVFTRPAKGSGEWKYVTGTYVKKVLNYVFAWQWDFEIKDHGQEGELIWVLGRLTVHNKGKTIVKEQFGRAEAKKRKDGTGYLDFGNDLKAASTDALKKCASELGIASDIYGANEFREIAIDNLANISAPEGRTKKVDRLEAQAQKEVDSESIANVEVVGEVIPVPDGKPAETIKTDITEKISKLRDNLKKEKN